MEAPRISGFKCESVALRGVFMSRRNIQCFLPLCAPYVRNEEEFSTFYYSKAMALLHKIIHMPTGVESTVCPVCMQKPLKKLRSRKSHQF